MNWLVNGNLDNEEPCGVVSSATLNRMNFKVSTSSTNISETIIE